MEKGIIKITKRIDLDKNTNWPDAIRLFEAISQDITREMGIRKFPDWRTVVSRNPIMEKSITSSVNTTFEGYYRAVELPFLNSLTDISNKVEISYKDHVIKIQEFDYNDPSTLKLTLYLTTEQLLYLGSVSDKIICAKMYQLAELESGNEIETFMLEINETSAISSYMAINHSTLNHE